MTQKRVLLPIKRFKQRDNDCAVCAAASIANYYDKSLTYRNVRRLVSVRDRQSGLFSSEQARLLNELGFEWTAIVTSDVDLVDYSWTKLAKKRIIAKLKKLRTHIKRSISQMAPHSTYSGVQKSREQCVADLIEWLEALEYDNNLIIDNDFPKYIRKSLDRGHPVGVSINATSMFKMKKGGKADSDITGEHEEHAVVVRGYDEKGVFIVDSNHGFYKVSWERLLINMPAGDLILVG